MKTNKFNFKLFFFLFLSLIACVLVRSAQADEQPVQQLKAFLQATKSLTADFKQVLLDEAERPMQISYGEFYLQRPGKFRWDYKKPFQQQILANAGKVWFYDADLEQVTVKKLDDSIGSTPALLLSGQISLDDNFTMLKQGADEGLVWVKLLPKSQDSTFKYVLIGLSNGVLAGMELNDNFGQLTRIYFSNVKVNPPIKTDLFDFKPPKNADIVSE